MSTKEVFGLPNSDLVPGVYEGELFVLVMVYVMCIPLHYPIFVNLEFD